MPDMKTLTIGGYTFDITDIDAQNHINDMNNPHKMTAEQIGARPDSWMPTAEQIGARPDSWMPTAEQVGARPDTWMPTATDIGAAPAGYGLGEGNGRWTTDFNTTIIPGFYACNNAANAPAEENNYLAYGTLLVEARTPTIKQTIFYNGLHAVRYSGNNGKTWEPWEWVNPPMRLGTEYRTTERYNGKPVYAKLIDFGALPNASYKNVSFYANDTSRPISVAGQCGADYNSLNMSIPSSSNGVDIFAVNYSQIRAITAHDESGQYARALVKYWKTTD